MGPSGQQLPWYAVQVRPRYEKLVAGVLENKGFESFLPLYLAERRRSDRMVVLQQPVFPGYLFCRLDLRSRILPLFTTPGVVRLVGCGRDPVEVSEPEVSAVRRIVESGLAACPWPMPKIGEMVMLESGPLAGLEGRLVSMKKRHRLVVSVALLQRAVAVEVDEDAVRPLGRQRPSSEVPLKHVAALAM